LQWSTRVTAPTSVCSGFSDCLLAVETVAFGLKTICRFNMDDRGDFSGAEHSRRKPSADNRLCCFARNFAIDRLHYIVRAATAGKKRLPLSVFLVTGTMARIQGQPRGQSLSLNLLLAVYLQGR
jgi:hypothetical protein